MSTRKCLKRCLCILGGFLIFATNVWAESNLLSVKKGGEGDKSWAVLGFDSRVDWMGISQSEGNRLTLYFSGSAGEFENASIAMMTGSTNTVTFRTVRWNSNLFKADIICEDNAPLAVFKRGQNMIIAINDTRLMEGNMTSFASDVVAPAGDLIDVSPTIQGDQCMTSFQFDDHFEWTGYLRPSRDIAALVFKGSKLGVDTGYSFDDSALEKVRFVSENGNINTLRAVLFFSEPSAFSIVRKPQSLIIQTAFTRQTERFMPQEAAAPVLTVNNEINDIPEQAPEKSLSDIVDEIESELLEDETVSIDTQPATSYTNNNITDYQESGNTQPIANETPPILQSVVEQASNSLARFEEDERIPDLGMQQPAVQPQQSRSVFEDRTSDQIPWDEVVSFEFVSQPIKSALRLLAGANDLNMVITEGVEGLVTMDLRGVTLRQALNNIVHTHDCEYIVANGIITVKSVKTVYTGGSITKVYRLKYANANNVAEVIRQVVSGDSLVKVFYPEFLSFVDAGKNRKESNKVAVQGIRRSSTIVVTDRPEKIAQVDDVIAELDRAPIQIMIESKLIELSPVNKNELGINWDKTINTVLWGQSILSGGDVNNYSVINPDPGNGGDWQMASLSAGKYQAVLDFLKEKTDTKLKSNPRLLARDNEESSISVGTTVPVPRIQRGLGGQGDMVTFEYKEVNIQLNVTPHVSGSDEITMYVNPVIEEITGWVEYLEHRAPITDKRTVNSIVSVRNGETVVIGGLIKSQRVRTNQKVWLLGSLPLIGKLFQHEKFEDKQTDLMIFITPRIIQAR